MPRTLLIAMMATAGRVAVPVNAQLPQQRDHIESIRAELRGITDTVELAARESLALEEEAANTDDSMASLVVGFTRLRIHELTGGRDVPGDRTGFRTAIERSPDWPYAWLGKGLLELAKGRNSVASVQNIKEVLGIDYLSRAADDFARAAELDPTFPEPALRLAEVVLDQRINPDRELAASTLGNSVAATNGTNPDLQLALGRILMDMGEPDSASIAFKAHLAHSSDSAIGLLELSRAEFLRGNIEEGRALYFLGAGHVQAAEEVSAYARDLTWISDSTEINEFMNIGSDYRSWLRDFWARREALDVRRPGERIAEHYARYYTARTRFRKPTPGRTNDPRAVFGNPQDDFDDRGMIYMRHGEPDEIAWMMSESATTTGFGFSKVPPSEIEPNQSWKYERPDGDLVFHFVAINDVQDYRLVESLLDVYDMAVSQSHLAGVRTNIANRGVDPELFSSRQHLSPLYQRLAMQSLSSGGGSTALLRHERDVGRQSVEIGTTTDRFHQRFAAPLEIGWQKHVVTLNDDGAASVLLLFGMEQSQLEHIDQADRRLYRIQTRFYGTDQNGRVVEFVDSLRNFVVPAEAPEETYVVGATELGFLPGDYVVRGLIVDSVGGGGATMEIPAMEVADPEGPPTLGDLILGGPDAEYVWDVGEREIPISLSLEFASESRVDIYYELYGMDSNDRYRVNLELRRTGGGLATRFLRLFSGEGDEIAFDFVDVSTGPVTRVTQSIALGDLEPGDYELLLRVEFGDNRTQERMARLSVR